MSETPSCQPQDGTAWHVQTRRLFPQIHHETKKQLVDVPGVKLEAQYNAKCLPLCRRYLLIFAYPQIHFLVTAPHISLRKLLLKVYATF